MADNYIKKQQNLSILINKAIACFVWVLQH